MLVDGLAVETNPGASYAISKDDFERPPQALIEKYKFGDRVTRDNFTSVVIDSFARSRASYTQQTYYFDWLETHTGLDYRTTLSNFLKAGGYNNLTGKERQLINTAFKRIPAHQGLAEQPRDLDIQIEDLLDNPPEAAIEVAHMSASEFQKYIGEAATRDAKIRKAKMDETI